MTDRDRARQGWRWSPVPRAASAAPWRRRSRARARRSWSPTATASRPRRSRPASATPAATRSRSTVDVSDVAAVERLAATTVDRYGRVDVLCNNAGVSTFNLMRDQTLDDWKWVFDVNFWGVVHGVAHLPADHARAGHARPRRQHRVHRRAADAAPPFIGPYCATKAAVVSVSETLAQELAIDETPDRRERAVPELGRHPG